MMATRRINAATTWLIRSFAPGCPTMLRSWSSKRHERGELLTIFFDLPSHDAFTIGLERAASAGSLRLLRVGKRIIRDLQAEVSGQHRTLKVQALLVDDGWDGKEPR